MPGDELSLLIGAAEAAGEIALRHLRAGVRAWEKPGDQGPVTEADLEIDAMLRDRLTGARPDHGWLSEESPDDGSRLTRPRVFIVDPIDGTRAFIAGEDAFCHAIALAEAGEVVAAVVHLPRLGATYAARRGAGATLNGRRLEAADRGEAAGATVLSNASGLRAEHWPGGVPQVTRHHRPSLAYRLCLVAEGRFDATLSFRDTWDWDIAAGDLIAREAGAVVTTATGQPPGYLGQRPAQPGLIVAGPSLHAALLARRRGGDGHPG